MTDGVQGPVCLAVSGGSDSISLLDLASGWSRQSGRNLLVLTVDHGLRPEAAGETEWVAETARALGHEAQILRWTPDKRSQSAARTARHTLLAEAARQAGAGVILLGHTQSDVIETLLMRLARPARLAGAVGPQPVSVSPVWPAGRDMLIGRPLIGWPRHLLRERLVQAGKSWVDDPSNISEAYERVRVRRLMERLDACRLGSVTADAMRLRALEDWRLAGLLRERVRVDEAGLIEADLEGAPLSSPVFSRFLDTLIQTASGRSRTVPASSIEALGLEIGMGGPAGRITLGGAWLQRRGETLLAGRDPGELKPGWVDGVWDGRYVRGGTVSSPEAAPFLVRHALPDTPFREIVSARIALWSEALLRGARLAMEIADLGDAGGRALPDAASEAGPDIATKGRGEPLP